MQTMAEVGATRRTGANWSSTPPKQRPLLILVLRLPLGAGLRVNAAADRHRKPVAFARPKQAVTLAALTRNFFLKRLDKRQEAM